MHSYTNCCAKPCCYVYHFSLWLTQPKGTVQESINYIVVGTFAKSVRLTVCGSHHFVAPLV